MRPPAPPPAIVSRPQPLQLQLPPPPTGLHDRDVVLVDRSRFMHFRLIQRRRNPFRTSSGQNRAHSGNPGGGTNPVRVPGQATRFGDYWFAFLSTKSAPACGEEPRATCDSPPAVPAAEPQSLEPVRGQTPIPWGPHTARVLWAIHSLVMNTAYSVVQIPDVWLADRVWGCDKAKPRHWRGELAKILNGLMRLHVGDAPKGKMPLFSSRTRLISGVADSSKQPTGDPCSAACPAGGGPRHHHFLVQIGQGFLGVLEQFAPQDAAGPRQYEFKARGKPDAGPSLREFAKRGDIRTVYLPARLGDPAACAQLPRLGDGLLQTLVRETTRPPRKQNRRRTPVGTPNGDQVRSFNGRSLVRCPLLKQDACYTGFNGNGRRRGLGYKLTTWMERAGFEREGPIPFLDALSGLAAMLDLTVVGLGGGRQEWYSLTEMQALARTVDGRQTLNRIHVRIYTEDDHWRRWAKTFGWPEVTSRSASPSAQAPRPLASLVRELHIKPAEMAAALGVDPSFLSKVLRGVKSAPKRLMASITKHLEKAARSKVPAVKRCPGVNSSESPAQTALAYRKLDWAVIPMIAGTKRAYVQWKAYQERLPTEEEVRQWWTEHPKAGIGLVLGPHSGIFVIDVDGPEAHEALINSLGKEPPAPKALSGSRKPSRYHLFFRHPPVPTSAKATPWHDKLEFRGHRGLVVLPPSLHSSGHTYAWAPGQSLADVPLPPVPQAILAALQAPRAQARPQAPRAAAVTTDLPELKASPSTRDFLAGKHADGERWNERLFKAACDLKARGTPQEQAIDLLIEGAQPRTKEDHQQALRTIASAYSQDRQAARH